MRGVEVIDLGVDAAHFVFAEKLQNGSYDILGKAALHTTTMLAMSSTIEDVEETGL